jgi:glyoxylase-like metal-dependent hydrolase (beta-lactamase superfamily II)
MSIHPVSTDIHLPAGMAGPEPMDFDVRCYLVSHGTGLVLLDTGMPETPERIGEALAAAGAAWADVTDVVLTHAHPDHTGGLDAVGRLVPGAAVWGNLDDGYGGTVRSVVEGDTVRGLRVLHTPGHTPGHISLLEEDSGVLFVGDAFGSQDGRLVRAPARFTADAAEAERSLRRIANLTPARMLLAHGSEVDDPTVALHQLLA